MLEIIGLIVALAGVAYSSYTDIKTGDVPDKLSHSMIGIGAILVAFSYPMAEAVWIFAMAAAVFALGFIMYIFGQMGGGDVKLFAALTLLIPYYPISLQPFLASIGITPHPSTFPFIVSIFILSGIFFMAIIPIFYLRKIIGKKEKIPDFRKKILIGIVYCIVISPVIAMWFTLSKFLAIIFIPMFFALMIIPFKDDIVVLFFARKKKVKDLNEEDVLALEMLKKETIAKLGLWRKTFTEMELKKIRQRARKYRITTVYVCEDLPKYVPYILASLIVNLIIGDFFLFFLALS
jgi:Flp pilus assembly protein protease CpaA